MNRLRMQEQGLFSRQPAVCVIENEASQVRARSIRAQQISLDSIKFLALLALSSVGMLGALIAVVCGEAVLSLRILSGTVLGLVTLLLL